MAATASTMVALGTQAPRFNLPDAHGKHHSIDDFRDTSSLLVMFICNHCPYVKHIRGGLAALGRDYTPDKLAIVAINSNDAVAYPDDSPELMIKEAHEAGYSFPYLVDESQAVARAYDAACTPDFFLFDRNRRLVYRGQFDDSRPGNSHPVTGKSLRGAIDSLLAARPIPEPQIPSLGCNIKWRR